MDENRYTPPEGQTLAQARKKPLNRDAVKYIAIIAMTFNHIAHAGFIPYGTPRFELFEDIGFITAVTMSFFLVEGYGYTKSRRKYALRLFCFALLSQVPFRLALGDIGLNMIYTLWLCFLILLAMEYVRPLVLKIAAVGILILLSTVGDWPIIIPIATVLFALSRGKPKCQLLSYLATALMLWGLEYSILCHQYLPAEAAFHAFLSALPILLSAVLTLGLYNGRQAEKYRTFHRWFFYVYYPAHLLILVAIRCAVYGW